MSDQSKGGYAGYTLAAAPPESGLGVSLGLGARPISQPAGARQERVPSVAPAAALRPLAGA